MATLGQRLRAEREKRGLSVDDLAAQTRINPQYFVAIENDDASGLPGGFFYRSFLRQYARLLELPPEDYQAEVDRSLESEASEIAALETVLPDRQLNLPPIPTGRAGLIVELRHWLVRLGALLLVIIVCSGAYTFWQRYQASEPAAARSAPPPAPSDHAPPAAAQPAVTIASPPAQPAPLSPAPVTPPAAPSGAVRVIVTATELSWVGVWQGERQLFADVIHPGESRGFGASDRLRVRFGNAGGVTVQWNDRTIPATGPRGQVRTVDFRSDGYTVVIPQPIAVPVPDPAAPPALP